MTAILVAARPSHSSAHLLARRAVEQPDDILMTFIEDGTRYSHAEFLRSILEWSAAYRRLGAGAGTPIATMLPVGPDSYFAWLGAAWLRAVEVPINTDHRGGMLVHLLRSSGATLAVTIDRYVERFEAVSDQFDDELTLVVLDATADARPVSDGRLNIITGADFLAGVEPAEDLEPPGPAELASVVYTSGTTGPSKGVMIPWNELSVFTGCFSSALVGSDFRLYSPWPTFHVNGKFALTETLDRGGSIVLRERYRTEIFWSDIRDHGLTAAVLLGGVSSFVWSQPRQPDDADNPLAEVLMAPVIPQFREFEERFGVRINTGFASSEAGQPIAALHPLPNHRTCGRLLPEWEIRLVDSAGNEVADGETGEALVRSADPNWMGQGYLNLPDRTAESYEGGWFHTGDGLMRDAEGNYYYVDRIKDCIRRRGENISSFEVEAEVNAHPGVLESAAVAAKGDDGDDEVLVFVVPAEDAPPSPEELIRFLIPRMPRFMVPRFVEFVDELPKTHTGRTKKVQLRGRGPTLAAWDRVAAGVEVPR